MYADRARKIVNKPIVNLDPTAQLIAALKKQVQDLQIEIAQIRGSDSPFANGSNDPFSLASVVQVNIFDEFSLMFCFLHIEDEHGRWSEEIRIWKFNFRIFYEEISRKNQRITNSMRQASVWTRSRQIEVCRDLFLDSICRYDESNFVCRLETLGYRDRSSDSTIVIQDSKFQGIIEENYLTIHELQDRVKSLEGQLEDGERQMKFMRSKRSKKTEKKVIFSHVLSFRENNFENFRKRSRRRRSSMSPIWKSRYLNQIYLASRISY